MSKGLVKKFLNAYSSRSTKLIKDNSLDMLAQPKMGNETYSFVIGQSVRTTEQSQFKAGLAFEIKDRMTVHGYCKYLAGGAWHNQNDLTV